MRKITIPVRQFYHDGNTVIMRMLPLPLLLFVVRFVTEFFFVLIFFPSFFPFFSSWIFGNPIVWHFHFDFSCSPTIIYQCDKITKLEFTFTSTFVFTSSWSQLALWLENEIKLENWWWMGWSKKVETKNIQIHYIFPVNATFQSPFHKKPINYLNRWII